MDTCARMHLPTPRKLQLCVQRVTSAKQVLLRSVGRVTSVNQEPVLRHRQMVQKVTFVLRVTSVQLEQQLRLLVLLDIIILTKEALIFHSARFVHLVQPALTLAHPILPQLPVLRVTFVQLVLKFPVTPVCIVHQELLL